MKKDDGTRTNGRRGRGIKGVKVGVSEDGKGMGRKISKMCLNLRMETVIFV